MKVITTLQVGGRRINANAGDGDWAFLTLDGPSAMAEEQHAQAAMKLARKMGWVGTLVSGKQREGVYVHVWSDARHRRRAR